MKRVITALLLGFALLLTGQGPGFAADTAKPILRIGTEPSFAPFEFQVGNEFTGFDIELTKAMAERAGYTPQILTMGFDALIPALQAGSIDLAASGMTITDERKKVVSFTDSYYLSGLIVMVRQNEKAIKGFNDLTGKTIAVQIGTSGEAKARTVKNAKVKSFNSNVEAALELINGGADAVINDAPVAEYYMLHGGKGKCKIVGSKMEAEEYGFAVAHDNTKLLKQMNDALQSLRKDGTYDTLYKKWFGDSKKQAAEKTSTVLCVGTDPSFVPCGFMENGMVKGFDIDLINAVAHEAGMETKIVPFSFDSLISQLNAGNIDVIASGMTITDDRKKAAVFTQPYFKTNTVIVVRDTEKGISGTADLKGKTIGVQLATTNEDAAHKIKGAKVITHPTNSDAILALMNGNVDAIIDDASVTSYNISQNNKLKVVGPSLGAADYGFAVSKKNPALAEKLNKALDTLKANGQYDQIVAKWFGGTNATAQPKPVLRIATEPSFAPFEFQEKGELTGFDMDLIRAVAAQAGYEPKVSNIGFDALIPALQAGNIDVAASGMTITADRQKVVKFSKPYYVSGLIVMVGINNQDIKGINDLTGKRIACQIGTSGEAKARTVKNATIKAFNTNVEAALELVNGGVDAVINDAPVVDYYIATTGKGKVKTVGSKMEAEDYGFAMALNNTALAAKLDKALNDLKSNGEYDKIYAKWFGEQTPVAAAKGAKKVLRIATEPSFAPFEFQDKGELTGFDMDLIRAVAIKAGYEPKISNMGFDALIPALQAGNIDVAASGMSITPERRKVVAFTQPYYVSGLIIMVREDNQDIHGFDDLAGKRIACQIGTSGEAKARSVKNAEIKAFNTNVEAALELVNGGVDAVINDAPVVDYYLSTTGKGKVKTIGSRMEAEDYGFALALENKALVSELNAALAEVRSSGEYDRIHKKWFGDAPVLTTGKILRIGSEPTYQPFEYQENGEATGYDMDMIRAVARRAGYIPQIVNMGFDAIIPALQAGNVDVAASAMTITSERKKIVDFTDSYYVAGQVIMTNSDRLDVKNLEDLQGKRIGVQIGTSGEQLARTVKNATVKAFNTSSDACLELRNGGIDAIIDDAPVLEYYLATKGDKKSRIVSGRLTSEDYGFAVKKGNEVVLNDLNKALGELRKNGEYDRIYSKWFGAAPAKKKQAESPIMNFITSILPLLLAGCLVTIKISALSVAIGLLIGCFVGIGRICENGFIRMLAAVYTDFIRGTPLLVQIFLIYFALPQIIGHRVDPFFAAITACSINSGAYIAEIFRAGIQSINPGQMEAARCLGMNWGMSMRHIIVPQAFKRIIPPLGNEFIAMLKDSSLVSVIGFEELTRSGQLIIARTYQAFEIWIAVALLYLVMTLAVSRLVAVLEKRFNKSAR